MKKIPTIINSDLLLEGKANFGTDECGFRSTYLEKEMGYEHACGTLLGYSKSLKSWAQMFDFHFWSFNDEGLIVDSHSSIKSQTGRFLKVRSGDKMTYKLLHHSDFDFSKTSVEITKTLIDGIKNPISTELNRCYSPSRYDFIYIEGVFHHPHISNNWLFDDECEDWYNTYYEDLFPTKMKESILGLGGKRIENISLPS